MFNQTTTDIAFSRWLVDVLCGLNLLLPLKTKTFQFWHYFDFFFLLKKKFYCLLSIYNPFAPNAPFLYSLTISEKHMVFWYFQGVKKGCIGNEWDVIMVDHVINRSTYPENIYCLKSTVEICSKSIIKTQGRQHWHRSGVFIAYVFSIVDFIRSNCLLVGKAVF